MDGNAEGQCCCDDEEVHACISEEYDGEKCGLNLNQTPLVIVVLVTIGVE